MVRWVFENLREIAGYGYGSVEPAELQERAGIAGPFQRRCRIEGSRFVFEGNREAFHDIGFCFVSVAAFGMHIHLDCEPAIALSIDDPAFQGKVDNRGGVRGRFQSYEYEARPMTGSVTPPTRHGSVLETSFHGNRPALEGEFWILGNLDGLLSMAQHCFDLGETDTPPRTSADYVPGIQLSPVSIPFAFSRSSE